MFSKLVFLFSAFSAFSRPRVVNPRVHPCAIHIRLLVKCGPSASVAACMPRCRPECGWNFARRDLRQLESIESGGKVNRLAAELRCERLPSIDLAHVDLT
jgi:hypothetical protein